MNIVASLPCCCNMSCLEAEGTCCQNPPQALLRSIAVVRSLCRPAGHKLLWRHVQCLSGALALAAYL